MRARHLTLALLPLLAPCTGAPPLEVLTETVHVVGSGPPDLELVVLRAYPVGRPSIFIEGWTVDRSDRGQFEFTVEVDAELCSVLEVHGRWGFGTFLGLPYWTASEPYKLGRCGEHEIELTGSVFMG